MKIEFSGLLLLGVLVIAGTSEAQTPDLTGGYLCRGQCKTGGSCATIKQDGVDLTITNEQGEKTPGQFVSNSMILAENWHISGTLGLHGDTSEDHKLIVWENKTVWIKSALCPDP